MISNFYFLISLIALYLSIFVHFIYEIERFHSVLIRHYIVSNCYTSLIDLSVPIFVSGDQLITQFLFSYLDYL